MPIDIDEFESADSEHLVSRRRPLESDVLEFLAFNPEKAYTRKEISAEVDATLFELASVLSQLQADSLVRMKGSYWTITDRGEEVSRR